MEHKYKTNSPTFAKNSRGIAGISENLWKIKPNKLNISNYNEKKTVCVTGGC